MVKFKFLIEESFKRRFNNRGMRVIRGMGLGLLALFSSFTGYSQENIAPVADTISTSYVSPWENLFAINDGFEPLSSTDNSQGAYGNWPRLSGEVENWDWVQYSWDSIYLIDRSEIYWWSDRGGIRIPDSSYIQYRDIESGDWKEISGDSGFVINVDEYSVVTFEPVLTNAIRYYMMSMTESTGVLEWKIFGKLVEQDLYNSTIEVTPELTPGVTGTVKVTAVESGGGRREGYTFRVRVKVRNELTGVNNHDESYIVKEQAVNGMLTELILDPTDANGETFFDLVLPPAIDPTDGITIDVMYNDGLVSLGTIRYYIPAMLPPAMTADNTANSVDDDIDITFNDDSDWRAGCSEVLVGGVALAEGIDYDLAAGLLKLKPSGLNSVLVTSGIKEIRVKAPGYDDAVLLQEIKPGQPSVERSVVKSLIPPFRGVQTSLLVVAKDRYGNLLENCQLWYEVKVTCNDPATAEVYSVNGLDVSSDQPVRELPLTGNLGR
ncbi:MAG: DUF1533 domain-containing protein [Bacteroidia bacterium]|nr:MAG: DUF1533 domain-containing protein [Bacteroidia bacterium]